MKARPFLAALLAAALALLTLGGVAWWLLLQRSPLSLQQQRLVLPVAARFVPRTAPLSLHWLVGPDQPAAYARAVAPPRQRRQAAAAADRLRDGAFAAAGLDYATELAPWLGGQSSLALLTPLGEEGEPGWVLALRSRDNEGARRFLQRFWQTRSLAGTDLQITSYRGMGLISGRGALIGQDPRPLATALINDDLVLIASGRGALEQALDVSQIDELNQAASPQLQQAIAQLGQGIALLTARPQAMEQWLGLPAGAAGADSPLTELVASLVPSGRGLMLDAVLQLNAPMPQNALSGGEELLRQLHTPATSLALIQNPAQLLAPSGDPWQAIAGPLLAQALGREQGPLPTLVAAADPGPLLWAQQREGWLLGTRANTPDPLELQSALESQGFSTSPLQSKGHTLLAWTQLQSKPVKGNPDQLQARLAGARAADAGLAWWGQGLTVLDQQQEGRQGPQARQRQLEQLDTPQAPVQWAMDAATARGLLERWQPWRLLTTLSSSPLSATVEGAALSLQGEAEANALRLRGQLDLG
jgi:hypothetical protein